MKRFILLTFGFLGWAFYEMSGGSDFESATARMARLEPAPQVTVSAVDEAPAETQVVLATPSDTVIDTDPPASSEVTRVSLNLTTLQDVQEDAADVTTRAAGTTNTNLDPDTGVAVNAGVTLASADTPAIIPSLILPNDSGAANVQNASLQTETEQPQAASTVTTLIDLRTVSGNRVNVRGGPGTNFDIVGKLVRGDAVEIIEDNGAGWVLMRSVDTGEQGWLADFLLNS